MHQHLAKILLFLSVYLLYSACSPNYQKRGIPSNPDYEQVTMEEESDTDTRIVTYKAQLDLVVKDIEPLREQMQGLAKNYGGYLQRFSYSYTVMRVEASQLEAAITAIGNLGKIKRKEISGEDVTDAFYDYKIRLENAEKTRKRYLELLDKASTVEDILKIERELSRINEKIELLKGRSNRIENQVQLATIRIATRQKVQPGPLGYVGIGLYKLVSWLFVWK